MQGVKATILIGVNSVLNAINHECAVLNAVRVTSFQSSATSTP